MLTGFKGVKYGLSVPKKEGKEAPKKVLAAFAGESDDDDEEKVAKAIERQAQRKQSDAKVAKLQAAALAEDPSIFDYDSHFDEIQHQRGAKAGNEIQARKSRYIEGLLDKAKERQKEQDIVYERRLLRERKAEDHLFGDKERFVTAAYKQKLEEDKKWLEEEALQEKIEAEQDVRKRGHMGDFYRNLLSNNVAFGTAEPSKSNSGASTSLASSSRGGQGKQSENLSPPDEKWEQMRRAREAYEEQLARQSTTTAAPDRIAGAALQPASEPSARKGSESATEAAVQQPLESLETETKSLSEEAQNGTGATEGSKQESKEEPKALSREEKAAAARERFLARKRKAPG